MSNYITNLIANGYVVTRVRPWGVAASATTYPAGHPSEGLPIADADRQTLADAAVAALVALDPPAPPAPPTATELDGRLDAVEPALTTAQGDIDAVEIVSSGAAAAAATAQAEVDLVEVTAAANASAIATLQGETAALDSRLDAVEPALATAQSAITTVEGVAAGAAAAAAAAQGEVAAVEARVTAAEGSIVSLTAVADAAMVQLPLLSGQTAALDGRLDVVEPALSATQGDLATLTGVVAALPPAFSALTEITPSATSCPQVYCPALGAFQSVFQVPQPAAGVTHLTLLIHQMSVTDPCPPGPVYVVLPAGFEGTVTVDKADCSANWLAITIAGADLIDQVTDPLNPPDWYNAFLMYSFEETDPAVLVDLAFSDVWYSWSPKFIYSARKQRQVGGHSPISCFITNMGTVNNGAALTERLRLGYYRSPVLWGVTVEGMVSDRDLITTATIKALDGTVRGVHTITLPAGLRTTGSTWWTKVSGINTDQAAFGDRIEFSCAYASGVSTLATDLVIHTSVSVDAAMYPEGQYGVQVLIP